jgi:hypothetical protein
MKITITVDDRLSAQLKELGTYMPYLMDRIVEAVAYYHKKHVRDDYLSGQALNVGTADRSIGHLRDAIAYYRTGPSKYEVRPIGKFFNWAAGFETGMTVGRGVYVPPHPWQTPALRDLKSGAADRLVNDIMRRAIERKLK